jgi:hypothetical protein
MTTAIDIRRGATSASNAEADSKCPGRHLAQKGIPDKAGEYAETGNRIDAALTKSDPAGLKLEEAETYDACREIEAKLLAQYFGEDSSKAKVWRKERYWTRYKYNASGVVLEHSGEADVFYRYKSKALVLDYKSLFGDVPESPANMQLRDLATLIWGHFITLDQLAVAIIQPRVTHSPVPCLYDKASIERSAVEMFARVVASNDPKSLRVAGEVQCKWCKAKSGCPEYQKANGAVIPVVIDPPGRQDELWKVAMANWTPEQRSIAASILSPAAARLDEIKQYLKDGLAKDPAFIPGWGLSPGAKKETIIDPQACFDRFAAIGGTLDKFMATVSVGKSRLREAVHEVTAARGKALDGAMKTLTEGITESKQNSPSLEKVKP